jgi:hypothetical protein
VLVVQSLPFLASVALAVLESSRANDLAAWRRLEAITDWLPRRTRVAEAPAPADKRIETAQ